MLICYSGLCITIVRGRALTWFSKILFVGTTIICFPSQTMHMTSLNCFAGFIIILSAIYIYIKIVFFSSKLCVYKWRIYLRYMNLSLVVLVFSALNDTKSERPFFKYFLFIDSYYSQFCNAQLVGREGTKYTGNRKLTMSWGF